MTLSELIEHLEMLREEIGEEVDPPVRIAYQPSWPLRASVSNVCVIERDDDDPDEDTTLWIAASWSSPHDESPYAPNKAWEAS